MISMQEKTTSGRGGLYGGKPRELRVITAEEVGRILKCCAVLEGGERTREFMLVYLGLVTGLKLKDLIRLRPETFRFCENGGLLWVPTKPNEAATLTRIPMTVAVMSPISQFCQRHGIDLRDGAATILHQEHIVARSKNLTCQVLKEVSVRWAQDAFKALVRQAKIDNPYSISSLRNLFTEIVGETRGTDRDFIGYLLGQEKFSKGFESSPSIRSLNRRVAEHFEKTLRTIGVI